MKLLFLDEVGNQKDPKAFGLCAVAIDASHYSSLWEDFIKRFGRLGWNQQIEFKGRYLFSKMGDSNVTIDQRMQFARDVLKLNVANKNAKLKVVFAWNRNGSSKENLFRLAQFAFKKVLGVATTKASGKHLCSVFVDLNENVPLDSWRSSIREVLEQQKYLLVEDVACLPFDPHHVGLVYADLIAYLAIWHCLAKDNEEAQLSLFKAAAVPKDIRKESFVKECYNSLKSIRCFEV